MPDVTNVKTRVWNIFLDKLTDAQVRGLSRNILTWLATNVVPLEQFQAMSTADPEDCKSWLAPVELYNRCKEYITKVLEVAPEQYIDKGHKR